MGRTDGKSGRGKAGSPGLSEADKALWDKVAKETRPLHKKRPSQATENPPTASPAPPRSGRAVSPNPTDRNKTVIDAPNVPAPDLAHGTIAGLDKRRAARFRRGRLDIEARLDLHGYTQQRAHGILARFLAESQSRGLRCVLVITGKGRKESSLGGSAGILRQAVPQWLNQPPNRQRVISFDYAQPQHGGDGAIYVLLKRIRNKS